MAAVQWSGIESSGRSRWERESKVRALGRSTYHYLMAKKAGLEL